jgi:hypothetical protein
VADVTPTTIYSSGCHADRLRKELDVTPTAFELALTGDASSMEEIGMTVEFRLNFLRAIIEWVRAGYPGGVPPTDYVPLFAVLGSQLTKEECASIADELALTEDPGSPETIKKIISKHHPGNT